MKRSLLLILFLISLNSVQSQWIQQLTPNGISYLNCIGFFDQQNGFGGGWIAGDTIAVGRVIYTSNGGANWMFSSFPDSLRVMLAVTVFNSQNAYGMGACNLPGAGKKFNPNVNNFIRNKFRPIGFLDPYLYTDTNTRGYFMKTSDAGHNWLPYGAIVPQVKYLNRRMFH